MASNSTEYQENGGSPSPRGKLRVLFLASEWGSSKGGLSTMNRELAINTAQHSSVDVTFFVPQCNDEDKRAALSHKIKLVEATRQPGMEKLQWLSFLPDDLHIDVVVGHGIKLGPQANAIKKAQKCKWVQVVHTIPEELGMYKTYANPISGAEEKHKIEVELCQLADFVVSIGPKLNEAFRCYLSSCKKDDVVFNFTPGIFSEFLEVQQVAERKGKFQILLFGRGDEEDFLVKGFDLAAEAVASLDNIKLVFVGAPEGELEEVKNRFLKCGIRATDLTVRSFLKDRQSLKRLFCEVDLVVMPSRTEGFGLTALEALSAGLPILVSRNSGFGEALGEVLFGQYFVVHSDNVQEWVNAIKVLRDSDRKKRLKESRELRSSYAKTYCWKEQCEAFVRKMISLVQGGPSTQYQSVTLEEASQQTDTSSVRHPGTVPVVIELDSATFQNNHRGDLTSLMKEMANQFFDTMAADIPNKEKAKCLFYYLEGVRQVKVKEAIEGSLKITVECRTIEILEELWRDYCSGHLNSVAEEYLLTDDIKKKLHVEFVKLKTTISQEDYLVCKRFLRAGSPTQSQKLTQLEVFQETDVSSEIHPDNSERCQEPSAKKGINLLQDHCYAQAAGETHGSASAVDSEQVTLHFSVNGKYQIPNMERGSAQDMNRKQESFAEELANKEDVGRSLKERPAYLQKIRLLHDPNPTEEHVDSLRVSVECENPEMLEQLWRDYRSGYLNVVAEKCLLTDDIKRRFHLTSVKFKTTILEEDYLACKDFLLNNTESSQSVAERQVLSPSIYQAADETRILCVEKNAQTQSEQECSIQRVDDIQSSERKTTTQTLQNAQVYVADDAENMTQIVHQTLRKYVTTEDVEQTQDQSTDGQTTQGIVETQSQSAEEQNSPDAGKIQNQSTERQGNRSLLDAQGQCAQGQWSQGIKENRNESREEVTGKVLKETYSKSSKEISPWFPYMSETRDQTADKPVYTESIFEDHKDTGVRLLPSCFHDPDDFCEPLKANGARSIGDDYVQNICEALKFNNTPSNLDLSGKSISHVGAQYLSEALKVNETVTNLNLSVNSISHVDASYLSEALKVNKTVTNLNLGSNRISDVGAQYLSEVLKVTNTVTNLDLRSNTISDVGAQYLSKALKVNNTVTNLDLGSNRISDVGAQYLSEALTVNNTVTNLDLRSNTISDVGAQYLSEALKVNETVTNLNLSLNSISHVGAQYLSEALKVNNTLTNLDLRSNTISDVGAQYLSDALKVNKTVTIFCLDLSLHSIGHLGKSDDLPVVMSSALHSSIQHK